MTSFLRSERIFKGKAGAVGLLCSNRQARSSDMEAGCRGRTEGSQPELVVSLSLSSFLSLVVVLSLLGIDRVLCGVHEFRARITRM